MAKVPSPTVASASRVCALAAIASTSTASRTTTNSQALHALNFHLRRCGSFR